LYFILRDAENEYPSSTN